MAKFKPVSLAKYFNSPARLQHRRTPAGKGWHKSLADAADQIPRGKAKLWGIPFALGPDNRAKKGILVLDKALPEVEIPISGTATHLCFLHFADAPPRGHGVAVGEKVAEYVLRYEDGRKATRAIRSRFEIHVQSPAWGPPFASVHMSMSRPVEPDDKMGWGGLQTGVMKDRGGFPAFIYCMENPKPKQPLKSVVLRRKANLAVGILGLTLYEGAGHPLRHTPRRFYKLTLPAKEKVAQADLKTELDLGCITLVQPASAVRSADWTKEEMRGLGARPAEPKPTRQFLVEATGSEGATLSVTAGKSKTHEVPFGEAFNKGKAKSTDGAARLDLIHPSKTWVHVSVVDAAGKPTPTRIHFRGANGEYIPPYGHHAVVNAKWFEDYGGDLLLGGVSYAYVPGSFQIELPVGEVYVEIAKGFEHAPVRKRLNIRAGQRELTLRIDRWTDWRKDGWVCADTHVHFITPETAWLEGQGEGLNLINLLASQWGRLFTNVADISGQLSGSSRDDTLVWVGTENRHHLLGHMSLLGAHGDPVYPMCTGGPNEAYLGDADATMLTEWAQKVKERSGVSIRPHFPGPSCEEPVYFILGQLDGTELRQYPDPDAETLDQAVFKEWYRYLNCGYRVAAVGGTDKMSAGMPVGGARTYARLDPNEPFTFENWGKAIRAGRTFTTSGPLIDMKVDGRSVGDVIHMPAGGGTVEIEAAAGCAWPMHAMEIVVNGQVVARTDSNRGAKSLSIKANVKVADSSWIAARCASRLIVQHCWPIHLGAHTSPVYVVAGGKEMFSPSDATYMLTLIDGGLTYLDTLSIRFDEQRHRKLKAVFNRARRILAERLREQPQSAG